MRIGRVFNLLNRARIQKDFEDVVVADAPALIERAVNELIDWHVDQEFRQWQAVARPSWSSGSVPPAIAGNGGDRLCS